MRRTVLALATFPVEPALHGGSLRLRAVLRQVARVADVVAVTVTGEPDHAGEVELAPGLREVRVLLHADHLAAIAAGAERYGAPVGDVLFAQHAVRTPALGAALDRLAPAADVLLASHPFPAGLLTARSAAPLWLSTHNAEWRMKRALHPDAPELVERVRRLEADAVRRAALITTVSAADAAALAEDHGADADRLLVLPNGVDPDAIPYVAPADRTPREGRELRVLVLSSAHVPNVAGVRAAAEVLRGVPGVRLIVGGSAGELLADLGPDVELHHPMTDARKLELLRHCDVGLNPCVAGGGMQHKVAEYLAAGLPVVSTAFGLRGFALTDGREVTVAEIPDLPAALTRLRGEPIATLGDRAARGRAHVERRLDWDLTLDRLRGHRAARRLLGLRRGRWWPGRAA